MPKTIKVEMPIKDAWVYYKIKKLCRFGEVVIKIHEGEMQGIEKVILKVYPSKDYEREINNIKT